MHYFKIVLNTVDSPDVESSSICSNEVDHSTSNSSILELRIKAQLSLAYCYKELE